MPLQIACDEFQKLAIGLCGAQEIIELGDKYVENGKSVGRDQQEGMT